MCLLLFLVLTCLLLFLGLTHHRTYDPFSTVGFYFMLILIIFIIMLYTLNYSNLQLLVTQPLASSLQPGAMQQ